MIKKFIKISLVVLIIFVIINNAYSVENTQDINENSVEDTTNGETDLDSLSIKKNELEENINNANNQIEIVKGQLSDTLYELEELNTKILNSQQEIDLIEAEEENLVSFIEVTQIELDKITEKYNKQKNALEKRLVSMYKTKNTTYLDVLVNSNSLSDFISRYYIISKIAETDQKLLKSVGSIKNNLEAMNSNLENKKNTLETNKQKSERIKISLENMQAIKNIKMEELSQSELDLHNEITKYQQEILDVEKEIKMLALSTVGSEYIGGIMDWPVPGYTRITSPFGMRTHPITGIYKLHTGVDIGAPLGSTFIAANDGVVVKAEYNGAYGNMVVIDHGGGVTTLYAHGSEILVEVGQLITRGTEVLKVGSTGYSTGPHAHFEVRINGEYMNPLDYITSYNSNNISEN